MKGVKWTDENKLDALLRLPWRLRTEHNVEGDYYVAYVTEIPSAIATSRTQGDLEKALWDSLRESLRVFLTFGDSIPLPKGINRYPWELPKGTRLKPSQIQATAAAAYRGSVMEKQLEKVGA